MHQTCYHARLVTKILFWEHFHNILITEFCCITSHTPHHKLLSRSCTCDTSKCPCYAFRYDTSICVQSLRAHISHTQKSSEFEDPTPTQFLISLTTHDSANLLLVIQIENKLWDQRREYFSIQKPFSSMKLIIQEKTLIYS